MTDLLSLVVTISAKADTHLPAYAGRSIYALLMSWIEAHSADLAKGWLNDEGIKPYTCSNLIGLQRHSPEQRILKAGSTAWFRITALNRDMAQVLQARMTYPEKSILIDDQVVDVVSMTTDSSQHTWAGATTYEALSAGYLLAQADVSRRFSLKLVSPTTFKQNNLTQPFPTPDLVYGNLVDRWNAFSSIAINPELRQYCRLGMTTSQFNIKSAKVSLKNEGLITGTIGDVTYRSMNYDRYWQSMIRLLSDYAFYACVGRYTTAGMGQVQPMMKPSA